MDFAESQKPDELKNVVIQTAFIGDALLTIPLLKAVRNLEPERPLVLICRKGLGEFFTGANLVDEVIEINKSKIEKTELKAKLAAVKAHLVISPHESFRSALMARALNSNYSIGYRRWWNGPIFSKRIPRDLSLPEVLRQLRLVCHLDSQLESTVLAGISRWQSQQQNESRSFQRSLSVGLSDEISMRVPAIDRRHWAAAPASTHQLMHEQNLFSNPTLFMAPGSVWPTKMWTIGGFTEVGRSYLARGFDVVLLGAASEVEICRSIQSGLGSVNVKILAGKTSLLDMAWLLTRGALLVCNDNGAMHMGAVSGIPTVAVFGPTVLEFGYRPWQEHAWVVQKPLNCRPCSLHGGKTCPIKTHECMTSISESDVLAACLQLQKID